MKNKRVQSGLLAGAMLVSLSVSAFAADPYPLEMNQDLEGQGYIAAADEGNGPGEEDMIDLSFSKNGFFWYVNEDTYNSTDDNYDIGAKDYFIRNNSETVNLKVELADYGLAASGLSEIEDEGDTSKLELNLTGALAGNMGDAKIESNPSAGPDENGYIFTWYDTGVKLGQDLFENDATVDDFRGVFFNLLESDDGDEDSDNNVWTYSFAGTYDESSLPAESQTSDYVISLIFEAVSSSGQND